LPICSGGTGANLNLNGQTLTLGSGAATDPAMLILNTASNVNAAGGGTIAFGSHEAVIYAQGAAGNIAGVITGSNGLTKLGYGPATLTATATYSGATRISQGKLVLGGTNILPTGTDIILDSGINSTTLNTILDLNGN